MRLRCLPAWARSRVRAFAVLLACVGGPWLPTAPALAIDGNLPILNTAQASYTVSGTPTVVTADAVITTDPAAGNSPPWGLTETAFVVDENAVDVPLGTLTALDTDSGDVHSYAVDDPRFTVAGDALRLAPGTAFNFEADAPVVLDVTVTDSAGASVVVPVTVTIIDVNETPFDLMLADTDVPANTPGAVIGPLTVSDPDAGDSHVYTTDDARFIVVGNELQLAPGVSLPLGVEITINITATDTGNLSVTIPFTVRTQPPAAGDPVTIDWLRLAPGGAITDVPVAGCSISGATGPFTPLPDSVDASGAQISYPQALELADASIYNAGETLYVRVRDPAANADAASIEQVSVELQQPGGDSVWIQLNETAADSAEFVGYVQSSQAAALPDDCVLATPADSLLLATYTPAAAPAVTDEARVDPISRVFDSATGTLVNGAAITLVDVATGLPAMVFGVDGQSAYPATVVSGTSSRDAAGNAYPVGPGGFRFPRVAPGNLSARRDAAEPVPVSRSGGGCCPAGAAWRALEPRTRLPGVATSWCLRAPSCSTCRWKWRPLRRRRRNWCRTGRCPAVARRSS